MSYGQEQFLSELSGEEKEWTAWLSELLADMQPRPRRILEVGSGWGIFTTACLMWSEASVTTIDSQPLSALPDFKKRIDAFGQDRVRFIHGSSQQELPKLSIERFDLAFVDGSHVYQDVIADIPNTWRLLNQRGIMLLDDVFHHHNYEWWPEKNQTVYGVGRALWEWSRANNIEYTIYPLVHGIAEIYKPA